MKLKKINTSKYFAVVVGSLFIQLFGTNSFANSNPSLDREAEVIYQSQSSGRNIHSYQTESMELRSKKPELIYISQAFGPAIYSYTQAGSEVNVPWNIEYVDTAFNPAIYSYENHQSNGEVKILPIELK